MVSPYTLSKEKAHEIALNSMNKPHVYSTFSESIKRKVNKDLWPSTPSNAHNILLLPVRLTRLEKEELLAVLATNRQS